MTLTGALVMVGAAATAHRPALAEAGNETIVGTLVYRARGLGANGDGLANAFFGSAAIGETVGSLGQIGGLFGPLAGLDPEAAAGEIGAQYGGQIPIDARYDARIDFRLREDGDPLHWVLDEGAVSWSSDSTTELAYEGGLIRDDFHGQGYESLDPATSSVALTFTADEQTGLARGYRFDIQVTHDYQSEGTSVWTTMEDLATITMSRRGDDALIALETPFGTGEDLGMPPVLEDLFAGDTWTVAWSAEGTVDDIAHPVQFTDDLALPGGGTVMVEVTTYYGNCAPRIVVDDGPRFAFDDAGLVDIGAHLESLPAQFDRSAHWALEAPGFDITYTPDDAVAPSVTIEVSGTPPDNSAFGEKTLTVDYTDPGATAVCAPVAPTTVELFFPRDATWGSDGTWNWFEYWLQTPADADVDGVEPGPGCAKRDSYGYYNFGSDVIYLCPAAARDSTLELDRSRRATFIDNMAVTILHEDQHRRNWHQWHDFCTDVDGDGIPDPAEGCFVDTDGDRVPDDVEPALTPASRPLDPTTAHSCYDVRGAYLAQWPDEHCLAYAAELAWPLDAVDELDWARPGSQWP